jgi:hypothetical protein
MSVDGRRTGVGSTTVAVEAQTVADAPTRRADAMSADRPPSAPVRGRSATVCAGPGRIDHRHRAGRAGGRASHARPGQATPGQIVALCSVIWQREIAEISATIRGRS